MANLWEVRPGWLPYLKAHYLLAGLRTLYDYETSWQPDRATGWVYAEDTAGNRKIGLQPALWPGALAETGPALLDELHQETGIRYEAACYQAYKDGAGTGWHYDADWPEQAVISLGVTRTFGMKGRTGRGEVFFPVSQGDLLVMHAGCQEAYEHNVVKEDVQGERVSLVFRAAKV